MDEHSGIYILYYLKLHFAYFPFLSLSPLPPPPSPPIFSLQAKGRIFVGLHVKLVLGVVLTSSTG